MSVTVIMCLCLYMSMNLCVCICICPVFIVVKLFVCVYSMPETNPSTNFSTAPHEKVLEGGKQLQTGKAGQRVKGWMCAQVGGVGWEGGGQGRGV